MAYRASNHSAMVTGGAGGIGAAVAAALARQGMPVAVVDVDEAGAEKVAEKVGTEGLRAVGRGLDVRNPGAVANTVAWVEREVGPISVLANVAGILRTGRALDLSDQDWRDTFAVNTEGVFTVSRLVAAYMLPRREGSIVTVTSNAAGVPRCGMAAYAASKAAATHFTHCLGLELAPAGIRCNVVCPGSTDTEMLRSMWTADHGRQDTLKGSPEEFRVGVPLGRIAEPEDVAAAVAFFASDGAAHITMQSLYVDGGAALRT